MSVKQRTAITNKVKARGWARLFYLRAHSHVAMLAPVRVLCSVMLPFTFVLPIGSRI